IQALDVAGNISMTTAGNGLYLKEGTNATGGLATLVGGTLVVNTTKVTANSRIQLTGQGGNIVNLGSYSVTARVAGTSFTITSSNILDTNTVAWIIVEPN
ncbi:MAG: polysaccharide deacetylase, partial [Bacteroidota bacterium]